MKGIHPKRLLKGEILVDEGLICLNPFWRWISVWENRAGQVCINGPFVVDVGSQLSVNGVLVVDAGVVISVWKGCGWRGENGIMI